MALPGGPRGVAATSRQPASFLRARNIRGWPGPDAARTARPPGIGRVRPSEMAMSWPHQVVDGRLTEGDGRQRPDAPIRSRIWPIIASEGSTA